MIIPIPFTLIVNTGLENSINIDNLLRASSITEVHVAMRCSEILPCAFITHYIRCHCCIHSISA